MFVKPKFDYDHIKCDCGGIVGMRNREDFTCDKCGKYFDLIKICYDRWIVDDKTGYIFPVRLKGKKVEG